MQNLSNTNDLKLNTLMLYLLTLSNYIFAFATIPYQTRVLKPEIYGLVGFAMAIMMYFQLIIDFGFMLSATQRVAENHSNGDMLRKIATSVLYSKIVLSFFCLLFCLLISPYFEAIKNEKLLFGLSFLHIVFNSLIPDYLYRGLEKMKLITVRTLTVKAFFTAMIFLFLRDSTQYCLIPLFYLVGSVAAVIWSYYDLYKRFNIYIIPIKLQDVINEIKISFPFFVSRIATTVYGGSNALVLKSIYPTNIEIGFYTSADKIISVARSASSPIADSLYPYMVKHKDYRIIFKVLMVLMPIIVICSSILWFYSVPICVFIFGSDYSESGIVLKYMVPLMIIVLPSYVLGFPSLVPLGLSRVANMSNVVGAMIQLVGLGALLYLGLANIYSICILTCFTEGSILLVRLMAVLYGIKKLNRESNIHCVN